MKTITYTDIKERLVKKYRGWSSPSDMKRELVVYKTNPAFNYTMMALSGSPPKGYCIDNGSTVSLYDLRGRRFSILIDTHTVGEREVSK